MYDLSTNTFEYTADDCEISMKTTALDSEGNIWNGGTSLDKTILSPVFVSQVSAGNLKHCILDASVFSLYRMVAYQCLLSNMGYTMIRRK